MWKDACWYILPESTLTYKHQEVTCVMSEGKERQLFRSYTQGNDLEDSKKRCKTLPLERPQVMDERKKEIV